MIKISYRNVEFPDSAPFQEVATVEDLPALGDLLQTWDQTHNPTHGDLLRTQEGFKDELYVFNGNRGTFVEVDLPLFHTPWVRFWDEKTTKPQIQEARGVHPKRMIMFACAVAKHTFRTLGEDSPEKSLLALVRRWLRKEIPFPKIQAATYRLALESTFGRVASNLVDATSIADLNMRENLSDDLSSLRLGRALSNLVLSAENVLRPTRPNPFVEVPRFALKRKEIIPLSVFACGRVRATDPLVHNLPGIWA